VFGDEGVVVGFGDEDRWGRDLLRCRSVFCFDGFVKDVD